VGSAAKPHDGSASPQGESSADTEVSSGAAPPREPAPLANHTPASPGAAPPREPAPLADRTPASPAGPAADPAAPDGAPASLGALAAEPPSITAELRRDEAFNAAWRFLSRRERTEVEVRARLERNDVEPALIDEVLDELQQGGYVDDAGYARRFAEDRRNLDGWGAERIERRLRELGVDRHHIAAAIDTGDHDELGAATALLTRRFPVPPETPRDRERALGFLVRKGFELELAHDALRRHAASTIES